MAERKKKILIVNSNMHIGGVQKALVNLLWSVHSVYDVTLLLFYKGGELICDVPDDIKIIAVNSHFRYLGMTKNDTKTVSDKLLRSFYAAITRVFGRKYAIALMSLGQKKLKDFHCAISYLHNPGDRAFHGGCNDFVLGHVDASRKLTFLHCDYLLSGANTQCNLRQYTRFDAIAACSEGCADTFLTVNPQLRDKVRIVKNCHRYDKIRELAEKAPVDFDGEKLNVLTVARFGKEKSVERALQAIAMLGEMKNSMHYYIVGDGAGRKAVLDVIEREKLHTVVSLCGEMANPYGYVKSADLLLIPSRSEGAPMVIGEAACLRTPVLTTDTSSAKEMVQKPGFGWVCENSVSGIRDGLKKLLEESAIIKAKAELISGITFTDAGAAQAFIDLIDVDDSH